MSVCENVVFCCALQLELYKVLEQIEAAPGAPIMTGQTNSDVMLPQLPSLKSDRDSEDIRNPDRRVKDGGEHATVGSCVCVCVALPLTTPNLNCRNG
jgi:hypothetical protein